MVNLVRNISLAVITGYLFSLCNVPLPWTLGPITGIALYSLKTGKEVHWPRKIRDTALILLGYAMGRPFTVQTGHAIIGQLPVMIGATLCTVLAGLLAGWYTYKKTGIPLLSCLLGCVPGGLSQMVILADEMEGNDATAVTIMQTLRMLSVVFVVPFLTMHVLPSPEAAGGMLPAETAPMLSMANGLPFALVAIAGAVLGKFLKLPTATLLGPILSTGAYILYSGETAPLVPLHYINMAQVCVGIYIGTSINLAKIKEYHGLLSCLLKGVGFVLCISLFLGFMVAEITEAAFVTAFLSTAPGGLTEMGITALLVGADISTMTAYQLVRLLFIMLFFPPLAKFLVARYEAGKSVLPL